MWQSIIPSLRPSRAFPSHLKVSHNCESKTCLIWPYQFHLNSLFLAPSSPSSFLSKLDFFMGEAKSCLFTHGSISLKWILLQHFISHILQVFVCCYCCLFSRSSKTTAFKLGVLLLYAPSPFPALFSPYFILLFIIFMYSLLFFFAHWNLNTIRPEILSVLLMIWYMVNTQ